MTTVGDKDSHFTCQLKMEEQIHCAHTVKLTAPGLVIDKAGTVATELTYSFAANDGLTAQDIGIVGHNPGEYTIFADITSPYYVSANGLKIKKDKIGITIRDAAPDGWQGTLAGIVGTPISSGVAGDLLCRYTHLVGFPDRYFNVAILSGSFNYSGGSAGLKVVAPNGIVTYQSGLQVYINAPGQWTVYPLEVPRVTVSGIGNTTWNAIVTTAGGSLRVDYGDRIVKGSGLYYLASYYIGLTGIGSSNPFDVSHDMHLETRLAGGVVPTTNLLPGAINFIGSYNRSAPLGLSMSGYRPSTGYSSVTYAGSFIAAGTAFDGAVSVTIGGT